MQVHRNQTRLGAVLLTLALGATACGGGAGGGDASGKDAPSEGPSGGTFSLYVNNPENPLVPSNTSESEGAQVLESLFTQLVGYDVETSEQEMNGVAESIESDDSKTWTIKLRDWTFHDGSPVTSDSFINAWNFAANSNNAQGGSYFFSNIAGYDDLQAAEGAKVAAGKTLSGLKKVDDKTFTVTLAQPFRQFPLTLGYTAFAPLPTSFFGADGKPETADDKAAQDSFGKKPVGNGPFQAASAFTKGKGMSLKRYEKYSGESKAKADAVDIKVYTDINTAYTAVEAGELDIAPDIPPETLTTAPDTFGDRYQQRLSSSFTYLGFPTYDARFKDPKVRRAFSMAIDRKAITTAIFNGTFDPAYSAISPVVEGYRKDACKACAYKPDEAKKLLAETDFDVSKPVELWFNAGAGHDEWVQAAGNQLRENLGITYKLQGGLEFAEYLPKADEKGFTGPFRLGWGMDYPSPQNYLEPLYTKSALPPNGSNTAFYDNPKFDALVKQGNSAQTDEEAIELYQQAEDLLLEDMPITPMFFGKEQFVFSDKVGDVQMDAFGHVRVADVTVTS